MNKLQETTPPGGLADAWVGEYILKMGERGADEPLYCQHNHLRTAVVGGMAVSVPDSDAAGQDALDGVPLEGCEDDWREVNLLELLPNELVLVVQEKSSVM